MKIFSNHTKVVIFDLDGTIFDSKEVYFNATRQTFDNKEKEYGFEVGKALDNYGVTNGAENLGISREQMKAWLRAWYQKQEELTQLFSTVPKLLQNLSNSGIVCAINTNRDQTPDEVRITLKKNAIADKFSFIQTALTMGVRKPDPKGINSILSDVGILPQNCFFVGDSYVDILAGKSAGVNTIAITTGPFSKKELENFNPHFIIDDINSVEDIVMKTNLLSKV